jgi:methylmalonyl-CoA mutase cobalamin-binding subunit
MIDVAWQALHDSVVVQGIYGPGTNVVEAAADMLRLLGHNMPPVEG